MCPQRWAYLYLARRPRRLPVVWVKVPGVALPLRAQLLDGEVTLTAREAATRARLLGIPKRDRDTQSPPGRWVSVRFLDAAPKGSAPVIPVSGTRMVPAGWVQE